MIAAALAYAKQGWPIFPARADKTPYTRQGVLDATTDARQIEGWWKRWPDANVALDVGGAGMMALDLALIGGGVEYAPARVGGFVGTRWEDRPALFCVG